MNPLHRQAVSAGIPPGGQATAPKFLGLRLPGMGVLLLAVCTSRITEGMSQTVYVLSREFGGSPEETTCV